MSYDLAVWHSDTAMSVEDAGTFYSHIGCEWTIVREHPALRAFCHALIAEFPGILDPDDLEKDFTSAGDSQLLSYADIVKPRAVAPSAPKPLRPPYSILASFTGTAMTMSLGTRKQEIEAAIERLAAVHGLVVYNPQVDKVALPPFLVDQPCVPLPEPVQMVIAERPDSLPVRIWLEDQILFDGVLASRQEAHNLARKHTLASNRLAYQTEDKRAPILRMPAAPPTPGSSYIFDLLTEFAKRPRVPKD